MSKQRFFLSGLPRTGSTVLGSILNQNPDIFVTPTSPLPSLLDATQNSDQSKIVFNSAWRHRKESVVIDKHRSWAGSIQHIENILGVKNPKIIATVRDIPSILSSFMTLVRNNPGDNRIDLMMEERNIWPHDSNRVDTIWYHVVKDNWLSLKRGFESYRDNILIIDYDDLNTNPECEIDKIYNFLELESFSHKFSGIENTTPEDDHRGYRLKGLHDIRPNLGKAKNDPVTVLGNEIYHEYREKELEFWK